MFLGALAGAGAFFLLAAQGALGAEVRVPAGSVDALAAAIAEAGPLGVVILEPGVHTESGSVDVTIPVSIVGLAGAVLESVTTPGAVYPIEVDAALHVRGTSRVLIQGLEMRPPAGATGGAAVLVERSLAVTVAGNTIREYQFGVLVQHGLRTAVSGNTIHLTPKALAGELPEAHGVVVINGPGASISKNQVTNALFGIWMCDRRGKAAGNTVSGSFIGFILCKVPADNFLISGSAEGSSGPATGWRVWNNLATGNDWGYLVIDGAHDNFMVNNAASQNASYDIELAGDSFRFGFLTPASHDNTVEVGGQKDLIIKDCGIDNRVNATLVDTNEDPCF